MSKGLISMFIARGVLGVEVPWMFAAGVAALVGHRMPFYLGLRGANGMAVTAGMLLYVVVSAIVDGWFPLSVVAVIGLVVLGTRVVYRGGPALALLALPLVSATVMWRSPSIALDIFVLVLAANGILVNASLARRRHSFTLSTQGREILARVRVLVCPAARRPR
jgi:glycerol-3-phosphate acyltransferase PlsY